jgi:hypothetical protein
VIPVEQRDLTDLERGRVGDCWPCCIASILELEYGAVPNFFQREHDGESESGWNECMRFLRLFGFTLWRFGIWGPQGETPRLKFGRDEIAYHLMPPGYWMASVLSPRVREPCGACGATGVTQPDTRPCLGGGDELCGGECGIPSCPVALRLPCASCEGNGWQRGLHTVVMRGTTLVWDPHPQRDMGHHGFVEAEFMIPTDPPR